MRVCGSGEMQAFIRDLPKLSDNLLNLISKRIKGNIYAKRKGLKA